MAHIPPEQPSSKFVNERKAADILGVAVHTLQNWRVTGRGPAYYKFEGAIRYATDELAKYASSCRRTSTTEAA